ncbi:MAG: outer membrane protein assembly factor BamA [Rhodoferax sp.]|nr:outer membrane protein assembly factor BamA [Rhodoferax sp.]MDP3654324.1 outer membrane protein assembly factor BamA [Rhodoferax sp.]
MQFSRTFLHRTFCASAVVLAVHSAWALEPFAVRDIRVEGLQRVEAGTIFASMPVKVGDTYSDEKAAASIRALFGLGLFKDVRIEANSGVLVVIVEERPTIADVDFSGTKEFDKEVLKKALRDIGLADGRPFDKALVDRAEQELKRQYINRSMYAAEVITTVTPIDRNRVNLSFAVVEGDTAKISDIRIVGNKAFSESTLRGLFDQDTGGWLTWYTKSNRYSRTKMNADIETLRSYYLARGYLEFKVDSSQVAISPNKQDISITINVTEGERFVVSKIKLAGNYLGKDEEFQSLISIQAGEAYNADQVAQTTKAFTDYFGNFGFAFARVEAVPQMDRTSNRVEITLRADPSRRVYVRRINVAGNDRTRDEVIRREFRQLEAAWYDGEKIRQSRNRVDRLGYFKEVSLETHEVAGSPDQVDLTVTVAEKPTGSLSLGAGLSSGEGLGFTFGFKQDNAFGSGNSLGMEVNTSKVNRTIVFNTTNPYFTDDGVSRTIDLYQRNSKPYVDLDSYSIETTGASMRFGIPFTDTDTVYVGGGVDRTTVVPGTLLPTVYQDFTNEFGFTTNAVPLTIGWARDTRDSALVPSVGKVMRTSGEWSVGGELRYARGTAQYQQFFPISKKVTAAFNAELSLGASTASTSYPVFKNFYSGGLGSVRGFEQGSLTTGAQRLQAVPTATGGSRKINFNAELLSPLPGGGNDRTLRMYGFVDAGGIYGADEAIQLGDMRSSFGVGISWISPVGPLRLAFARPIKQFDSDKIQSMQFQIGTTF